MLRLEDDMTMLCKFGLVVPMHASRVMVTVNYISFDPTTGEALYLFFSANDKESLAVAVPNPKSVLSEVSSCAVPVLARALWIPVSCTISNSLLVTFRWREHF